MTPLETACRYERENRVRAASLATVARCVAALGGALAAAAIACPVWPSVVLGCAMIAFIAAGQLGFMATYDAARADHWAGLGAKLAQSPPINRDGEAS